METPETLQRALVRLTHSYGLNFSAPDLVETPDGRFVFLDLNPDGDWAWIEEATGLPVLARLLDLLAFHDLGAGSPGHYIT